MESKLQYYVPENFWKVCHPVNSRFQDTGSLDLAVIVSVFIGSRLIPLPGTYRRMGYTILLKMDAWFQMMRRLKRVIYNFRGLLILMILNIFHDSDFGFWEYLFKLSRFHYCPKWRTLLCFTGGVPGIFLCGSDSSKTKTLFHGLRSHPVWPHKLVTVTRGPRASLSSQTQAYHTSVKVSTALIGNLVFRSTQVLSHICVLPCSDIANFSFNDVFNSCCIDFQDVEQRTLCERTAGCIWILH